LKEAKKSAFNLLAPAASYVAVNGVVPEAVISPLTTLVSHEMIVNKASLDAAKKDVGVLLNLAVADLNKDFGMEKGISPDDDKLKAKAQMLAVALGEVKKQALTDLEDRSSTDTPELKGKQALFSALQYLQEHAAALQTAFDAANTPNGSVSKVDLVKKALETGAAKPVVADLLAKAQRTTDGSAVSSATLFAQGFYGAEHLLKQCSFLSSDASGYCKPAYWQIKGSAGKVSTDNNYNLSGATWAKDTENGKNEWTLTSDGWKQQDICPTGKSHTYSTGTDGVTTIEFCSGLTERVTAREVDASNKTMVGLGLNPPSDFQSLTMPTGSKLYWFDFANLENKFSLYSGDFPKKSGVPNGFATIDSFVTAFTQPSASVNSSFISGWSGLVFSFAANNKVTLWDGFTNPKDIGTADYTRQSVNGVDVLIISAKAPQNKPGYRVMFAVKDGKVYGGSFRSKDKQGSSEPLFNKTMINAILAAGKKPAVLE
jgi:hypothetical protein